MSKKALWVLVIFHDLPALEGHLSTPSGHLPTPELSMEIIFTLHDSSMLQAWFQGNNERHKQERIALEENVEKGVNGPSGFQVGHPTPE